MDNDRVNLQQPQLDLCFNSPTTANSPWQLKSTVNSVAHHGIAFEIFARGVVIVGKSGIGKSELGLELIDRGHRLICDDLVAGQLVDEKLVIRASHEFGVGFMEIRGIGFIDIQRFFGPQTICAQQDLFLVIRLVDNSALDQVNQDRLLQLIGHVDILGTRFPMYELPIGANRNLPILVELIVKYAIAKELGYDSHHVFIEQQLNFLQQSE